MKYLVTSALPYANGPLHFGHLAGVYIPADIYTRYRRLQGRKVLHISGSDEHGVAIMLNARKAKMDYREYVNSWHRQHKDLFRQYQIDFDFFGQTSTKYHEEEVLRWFHQLNDVGAIEPRVENQLQCQDCENFLPDRFVEGTCYECGFEKARGDECPECGIWIEPTKLKNPVCKICQSHNILEKECTQYYLLLSKYHQVFRDWFATKQSWRKSIVPYVDSLSREELKDRAISRDLDWGIDVPLAEAKGKKLYVWFDAPIGYVSNLKEYLRLEGSSEDYIQDWWKNKDTQITHFIGKDNIIFHCIIFPVMAMGTNFINPVDEVPANQYLNLMGKQFSKSSGHYVDALEAINEFGVDALRYYLITLIPETSDSNFSWTQFAAKVNNELANNIGNFVNRCLKFSAKNWNEGLDGESFLGFSQSESGKNLAASIVELNEFLGQSQIKRGMEKIMNISHEANTYFSDRAPWGQIKTDAKAAALTIGQSTCFVLVLGVLLEPFLPHLSGKILDYFGPQISPELKRDIYSGDLKVLDSFFASGLKLFVEPEGLIPKIDEAKVAILEELLLSKA